MRNTAMVVAIAGQSYANSRFSTRLAPGRWWAAAWNRSWAIMITTLCAAMLSAVHASNARIRVKDAATRCDYLIVAPQLFAGAAELLAQHRNNFAGDDVDAAGVAMLEDILASFAVPDTARAPHEIIWRGLKWARDYWAEVPKYIVLIGDERFEMHIEDSLYYSVGAMPSFIAENRLVCSPIIQPPRCDRELYFSDTYYGVLTYPPQASGRFPQVAVGRIPCETAAECSLYVEKVRQFDSRAASGKWRNRAILIADDFMQGDYQDPIRDFYMGCERVAQDGLKAAFIDKIYLGEYSPGADVVHSDARADYFASVNQGALWTVCFGHGHEAKLFDEAFLTVQDAIRFDNRFTPTIMASFSCSNAGFARAADSSMCKRFLFAPNGGCIAYIACPVIGFNSSNIAFADRLFQIIRDSAHLSIGASMARVHQDYPNEHTLRYQVMGDPAITPHRKAGVIEIEYAQSTAGVWSLRCTPQSAEIAAGRFAAETYAVDYAGFDGMPDAKYVRLTMLESDSGEFGGPFAVKLPASIGNYDSVKTVVYAWNENCEARSAAWMNPAVLTTRGRQNQFAANPTIIIKDAMLLASIPHETVTYLQIMDLRGRTLFQKRFSAGAGVRVDLCSLGLASAPCVATIRGRGFHRTMQIRAIR